MQLLLVFYGSDFKLIMLFKSSLMICFSACLQLSNDVLVSLANQRARLIRKIGQKRYIRSYQQVCVFNLKKNDFF